MLGLGSNSSLTTSSVIGSMSLTSSSSRSMIATSSDVSSSTLLDSGRAALWIFSSSSFLKLRLMFLQPCFHLCRFNIIWIKDRSNYFIVVNNPNFMIFFQGKTSSCVSSNKNPVTFFTPWNTTKLSVILIS